MYSKRRYKISICSVILGELRTYILGKSFRNDKCCNHLYWYTRGQRARIVTCYETINRPFFLFITWRPTWGRGLHSFESFSFVIIALSRFISYHGRRKGKVGSPAGKTWRTSNRRNKKHKRSENYSRTHRFRRYHVEPFECCWANIGWKANFTCGIRRGD